MLHCLLRGLGLLGWSLFMPSLVPAELRQTAVFTAGQAGYHTFRIPALIATPKGTLLAFAEGRKNSRSDAGNIDLVLKRSSDGGNSWSDLQVIWDDGPHTCGNPCPVVDRDTGSIWLLMTRNRGDDNEAEIKARTAKESRTVWVSSSHDDGRTWTTPTNITSDVKKPQWTWYATGPGNGIQLRDGRLVIPCDHMVADNGGAFSHILYSDDHGQTWQLGGTAGPGTNESAVIERQDGSLLLNMRNYPPSPHRERAIALSKDRGDSWSDVDYDLTLIEPVCQASLIRAKPGVLLFSNPASRTGRIRMLLRLSPDDGRTWSRAKLLHPGPAAYSSLAVQGDTVYCLYERGERGPYQTITLATLPLADLNPPK